jgi:hypothetical protein
MLRAEAAHPSPKYAPTLPAAPGSIHRMDTQFFFSHLMLWVAGAIAAVGAVGVVGALFSMARQGYRND